MTKLYEVKSDWSQVRRELKRLAGIPNSKTKRELDDVLEQILMFTRSQVHIDTGSLAASGKKQSRMYVNTYRGHFLFGGFSPGVNNPVDYAIYEQDRGGPHNFMRGVEDFHPLWVEAIKSILRG